MAEGFTGTVRTLFLNAAVRLVPNDKTSDNAPDFRILSVRGGSDLGAAWRKVSQNGDRS